MPGTGARRTPVALRTVIDPSALSLRDPCVRTDWLGSFWPGIEGSLESLVVKSFKECVPPRDFEPCFTRLCGFYADLILDRLRGEHIDYVVRILGSTELKPIHERPLAALTDIICARLGALDFTRLFYRGNSRPPMRAVSRLGGPDRLKRRISYVAEDLFITPANLGGSVLVLDDIYNTGATARVYARALLDYAGARHVLSMNLAATRFSGGNDGLGGLRLDLTPIEGTEILRQVWTDKNGVCHSRPDCPHTADPTRHKLYFATVKNTAPCPNCAQQRPKPRKWWQFRG